MSPGCRYGETSRLVAALFRVARKVAPTIIFIDEVALSLPSATHRRLRYCFALAAACSPATCIPTCKQVDALLGCRHSYWRQPAV